MIFHVVIPARYDSKRLPGKALLDLGGKPIIQHVYERAINSSAATVVIATDDERIAEAAAGFGAKVCMTSPDHQSGTERLAEVVDQLGWDDEEIVVNVQGDEPLVAPENIHLVAKDLKLNDQAKMATLYHPIDKVEDIYNPNIVKIVLDEAGYAIYFSRAPVPWEQHHFQIDPKQTEVTADHHGHYGIYAYTAGFIKQYVAWPPCPLEKVESLEQLRVLWYGQRIHCVKAAVITPADVNTQEDLERFRELLG